VGSPQSTRPEPSGFTRRLVRIAIVGLPLLGLVLATWTPTTAGAANEAHVRTPVLWLPTPACGVVVERTPGLSLHLEYELPLEDTTLTPDELDDSRTHQFFGFCRQRPATELLPNWITRDDLDRSVDAGFLDPAPAGLLVPLDEDPNWAGCFTRLTPDDARRPITFDSAAAGVDWKLDGLPIGVWSVAGYTFEPDLNLWSPRPGFTKIVDDLGDPDQDLPALALVAGQQTLKAGTVIDLAGCADVITPATVTLEWSPFVPDLDWHAADVHSLDRQTLDRHRVAEGSLSLPFTVPSDVSGEILIRAHIEDALGRRYTAHAPSRFAVEPCAPDCGGETGSETGDSHSDGAGGCSATRRAPRSGPTVVLFALLLGTGRLRRRGRAGSTRPV